MSDILFSVVTGVSLGLLIWVVIYLYDIRTELIKLNRRRLPLQPIQPYADISANERARKTMRQLEGDLVLGAEVGAFVVVEQWCFEVFI